MAEKERLGILVPTDKHLNHLIGVAKAAKKAGKVITVFFTHTGVLLTQEAKYPELAEIIIPTFAQMKDPALIPKGVKGRLKNIGLWDITSLNLFRITWKNEPVPFGGGFRGVNYLELPSSLTGVPARIIALVGKWFPTGSHKVGATFGCLVPRLVASLTLQTRRRSGPRPVTTAAVVPMTRRC